MPRHKIPKQRVADKIKDEIYWCDPGMPKMLPTAKCLPCPPALAAPFQVEALFGEVTRKAAAFEQAEFRARLAEERCKQLESMLEFGQTPMQAVLCRDPFTFVDMPQVNKCALCPDDTQASRERQQADGNTGRKRHGYGRIPPPSRGSKNHNIKQCRPCRRLFTPGGCPDGALCNFCHYSHPEANDQKDNKSDGSRESRDVSTSDGGRESRDVSSNDGGRDVSTCDSEEAQQDKKEIDLFESTKSDAPWYITPTMAEPWYVAAAPPGLAL